MKQEFFLIESLYITLIGVLIVFMVLAIIYSFFSLMPVFIKYIRNVKVKKQKIDPIPTSHQKLDAETLAAISAAISLYFSNKHEEESTKQTISQISRRYSPWSSKIYTVYNLK